MNFLPGRVTEITDEVFDNVEVGYNGSELVALWNSSNTVLSAAVSDDGGETWSAPFVSYTSGTPFLLRGLTWDGSKWVLAANANGTSRLMNSVNLTTWTSSRTLTGITTTAISDLMYTGGKYYLTGTRGTVVHVAESVDGSTWSDVEQLSALNAIPNQDACFTKGALTVAFKEGAVSQDYNDRLLVTDVRSQITYPVLQSSKPVSGAAGDNGQVIIYIDIGARNETSIWKFLHRDNGSDTWIDKGVFASYGNATTGAVVAVGAAFHIVYGQITTEGIKLLHRKLETVEDGIPVLSRVPAQDRRVPSLKLPNFSVEISYRSQWIDITDHANYRIDPSDFGTSNTQWRRITATSPHYEGSYDIHAVRDNVTEQITITIYGQSQNHVTENILLLVDAVSQPQWRLRMTVQDHRETWVCQRADYAIIRSHVFLHNTMAQMKLSIPRHPRVSYEVVP